MVKIPFEKRLFLQKRSFKKDNNGKLIVEDQLKLIYQEIAIMKKLNHENVMKFHEIIDDNLKDKLYLVMDYA